MAALNFPDSPFVGERYPINPGTSGVTQYQWDGGKWNAVLSSVSLGSPNQNAFNDYTWPVADGAPNQQLTTDGSGNLTWDVPSAPSLQVLSLLEPFDDVRQAFTLVEYLTSTPFIPNPSTNLIVFLGGVPQMPVSAYNVTPGTDTIIFSEPPLTGSTFYAISNVLA
jgi:hypothetical protein